MNDQMTFRVDRFKPWAIGQHCYDWYNEEYFDHKLPVVHVGFYRLPANVYGLTAKKDGARYVSHILLNVQFKNWDDTLKQILLHEMIHVKHNNQYGHGKRFQKERRRLILAGAFDALL